VRHMRSEVTIRSRGNRTLILVAGLLSFSLYAEAQITLVHVTSCGPQTFPSSSCTIPSTGSGNLLVVAWASGSGGDATTITGITDNAGNLYAEAGNARSSDTGGNEMADIWYAKNSTAGATTVTVNASPSGSGAAVIWEFSGADPNSPLDQTGVLNSQAATTTPTGAPVTTTSPSEVVISVANVEGSVTGIHSGNSFTNDSTVSGEGWAHFITTSSGAYSAEWNTSTSGTYCSSTASFTVASAGGGACDLNGDGVVNVVDVQIAVNMDLGLTACPADLDGGVCGATLVQQILNAALGEGCTATIGHYVTLTWTASNSANIAGYNIYRASTSGGPYTQLNTSLVTGTSFTDSNVVAGQTYYYVATSVDTSNDQSGDSNQAQATVPSS
jgi:hypothetical protein